MLLSELFYTKDVKTKIDCMKWACHEIGKTSKNVETSIPSFWFVYDTCKHGFKRYCLIKMAYLKL